VLNTLTEHNFKDAFNKMAEALEVQKETTLRVMAASRSKVSFYWMAAPVPEIMDGSLNM
jgi:hypothetical protein